MPEDNDKLIMDAIEKARGEDSLIGAKVASREIFARLLNNVQNIKELTREALVCYAGAIAGYSCQACVRRDYMDIKGLSEDKVFSIYGKELNCGMYFSEVSDRLLLQDKYSVLALAAGAVVKSGNDLPIDMKEILNYVFTTLFRPSFGLPRIEGGRTLEETPAIFLRRAWPEYLPVLEKYCLVPYEWPIACGLALQQALMLTKDTLTPAISLKLAMECAVPMSKLDIKGERN